MLIFSVESGEGYWVKEISVLELGPLGAQERKIPFY